MLRMRAIGGNDDSFDFASWFVERGLQFGRGAWDGGWGRGAGWLGDLCSVMEIF